MAGQQPESEQETPLSRPARLPLPLSLASVLLLFAALVAGGSIPPALLPLTFIACTATGLSLYTLLRFRQRIALLPLAISLLVSLQHPLLGSLLESAGIPSPLPLLLPATLVHLLLLLAVVVFARMLRSSEQHRRHGKLLNQFADSFSQLADMLPQMVYVRDSQGRLRMVNRAFQDHFAAPGLELIGSTLEELLEDEEAISRFRQEDHLVLEQGQSLVRTEHRMEHSGQTHYFNTVKMPLPAEMFGAPALLGMVTDITDSIDTQQSLSDRELQLQRITDTAPDLILTFHEGGQLSFINNAGLELLGYSEAEAMALHIDSLVPEDEQRSFQRMRELLGESSSAPIVFDSHLLARDGTRPPVELRATRLSGGEASNGDVLIIARDIRDRVDAERALLVSEERYRFLMESISDILLVIDRDWTIVLANDGASRFAGLERSSLIGVPISTLLSDFEQTQFFACFDQVMRLREPQQIVDQIQLPGRETEWFEARVYPARAGILCLLTDVTQRKRAEDALRNSERRFRSIIEQASDMLAVVQNRRLLLVNPRFEEVLGYSREEVTSEDFDLLKLLPPSQRAEMAPRLFGEGSTPVRQLEAQLLTRDGDPVDVDSNVTNIEWDGQPAQLVLMRDVRERNRLRAQLQQAQRLESIGRVAGGIAHDFNNFLTVIMGHATYAERTMEEEHPSRKDVAGILKTSRRATAMVKQLLAFSRQQVFTTRPIDIHAQIEDLHDLLSSTLGSAHKLEIDTDASRSVVKADPTQFQQVMMNLAVNARDAMEPGGRFSIQTRLLEERELPPELLRRESHVPGQEYLRLTVRDTGSGIRKELVERIFEPFFTTKAAGKGTGLGLSMVYGIVRQSGGHVQVESQPGEGTTFLIDLPISAEEVDPEELQKDATETSALPAANVLVVDDEDDIRNMVLRVLSEAGLMVYASGKCEDALQLAEKTNVTMHLLISDIVMPDMRGPELVERLRKRWPDSEVLYISGFNDAVQDARADDKRSSFLAKPFTPDQILEQVRRMLLSTESSPSSTAQSPSD